MPKAWSDKKEHSTLTKKLAIAEGVEFQRLTLPLIQVIWPEASETPHLRSFDRAGIDHVVWSDTPPFQLVVQCKGFRVHEHEIGKEQAQQCRQSIQAFSRSGLRTKAYILIHNRDGRSSEFREPILAALKELVSSGLAERAELWDRQRFLKESFNGMLRRVLEVARSGSLSLESLEAFSTHFNPLEVVPVQTQQLVADQHSLKRESERVTTVDDPSDLVLHSMGRLSKTVLLGGFGFGKTTVLERTINRRRESILFVHGASISNQAVGVKDFLLHCVDADTLLEPFPEDSRENIKLLIRPTIEYILKDPESQMSLCIDALDESAFLSRRSGLQSLFNILDWVRIPVVLAMRTEFWTSRQAEFRTSYGIIPAHREPRNKKIHIVELLPWTPREIGALAQRYCDSLDEGPAKYNINSLQRLIESEEFESIYGDIPKRPLFLRLILDSVADLGIPGERMGRAQLFHDWAVLKIGRDFREPAKRGGERLPILLESETYDVTLRTAWEAMLWAAASMTEAVEGNLELRPKCRLDEVLGSTPLLRKIADPLGLFLNSLLNQLPSRTGTESPEIAFAHRAFQEFFLALFMIREPERFKDLIIPPAVHEWISDLREEGVGDH